MLSFGDWRPCFLVYGAAGLVWAAIFAVWFRERPSQHGWCNQAEIDLVENQRPPEVADPYAAAQRIPWGTLLRSRSMWLQCLMQFASNVAWTFFITWLPTVFLERYETTLAQSGLLSSLPLLAGMAACLLGGLATDHLTRRLGLRWGRAVVGLAAKSLAAASIAAGLFADDAGTFTTLLVLASFSNDLGLGAMWAYFQDTGGPYVATLLGWANMFGSLGAAVSPVLLGHVAARLGWTWALGICAAMFFLSGLCWFGIDASRPLASHPDAPGQWPD
jgi:sugar phosphate permease